MTVKKKQCYRVALLLLVFCLLASVTTAGAGAQTTAGSAAGYENPTWPTLDRAQASIEQLYNENYPEIADKIREIRGILPEECTDEALTLYWGSCGPTSIAFQKVLMDNGIYAETRIDSQMYAKHEYNLLRTRLTDGSVKLVLIDGSYRQFMRSYFLQEIMQTSGKPSSEVTDDEINAAILASGLPNILTFEFGNWQQAIQKIQSVLGEDVDPLAYNWIDSSYESQPYPEPSLQTSYTRYLSQEELAALKAGLLYEKPFEESLYIKGSWDSFATRQRFSYKGNGVYEVNLQLNPNADAYTCTIEGEQPGTPFYAAASQAVVYPTLNTYYNHGTVQSFLTDAMISGHTLLLGAGGNSHITVRIDTRAGIHSPQIRTVPAFRVGLYGDMDGNNVIDLQDIIFMQKALAGLVALTDYQKKVCTVSGSDVFSTQDLLLVQRYLANDPQAGLTGQDVYAPLS
ncbi:MAG TPA: dockerin type I repeat-containing protein [Candidatus Scatavimonas merdigallinarum]|uniref:Dockerin type I repeat-containing protein n=1 Tax=Candidatus Scatavimonas merdigallinarum TaxID=2840914 RepID=A0A9D0ZHW9_9FIRM|nr:dockerin type I repeat-containing protein [Candidatus Scatavimonas merdigallinarum]